MARENNYAFDAMNKVDPDNDITGGAIMYSEFEMDMGQKEQAQYKKTLLTALDNAYRNEMDHVKGDYPRIDFDKWVSLMDNEIIKERVYKLEEIKHDKDIMNKMDPKEYSVLEDAGMLQSLLEKHTGRVEDIRDIIGSDVPRPIEEFKVSEREYRR